MSAEGRSDVLARATRCLREEQDAALAAANPIDIVPVAADPTWSRIVTDVRRSRRRARIILVVIALHVGIGIGGVGVAAMTGRLAALVRPNAPAAAERAGARAPRARAVRARAVEAPAERLDERPAPQPPEAPAGVTPAATPAPAAPAARRELRLPRREAEVASAGPAAPAVDPLYREAHRLHFVRRDFAAALDAWDRFLASGGGPLLIEARYNRAIALAHLGRRGEAISALREFADGGAGGYRQREAQALIDRFSRFSSEE